MAKSTNGGKTKSTSGETKARRAPVRRATRKTTGTSIAVASELATNGQLATTEAGVVAAGGTGQSGSSPTLDLDPEDVRRRAYEIYCGRGCTGGSPDEDWLEAERQLRTRPH